MWSHQSQFMTCGTAAQTRSVPNIALSSPYTTAIECFLGCLGQPIPHGDGGGAGGGGGVEPPWLESPTSNKTGSTDETPTTQGPQGGRLGSVGSNPPSVALAHGLRFHLRDTTGQGDPGCPVTRPARLLTAPKPHGGTRRRETVCVLQKGVPPVQGTNGSPLPPA